MNKYIFIAITLFCFAQQEIQANILEKIPLTIPQIIFFTGIIGYTRWLFYQRHCDEIENLLNHLDGHLVPENEKTLVEQICMNLTARPRCSTDKDKSYINTRIDNSYFGIPCIHKITYSVNSEEVHATSFPSYQSPIARMASYLLYPVAYFSSTQKVAD